MERVRLVSGVVPAESAGVVDGEDEATAASSGTVSTVTIAGAPRSYTWRDDDVGGIDLY